MVSEWGTQWGSEVGPGAEPEQPMLVPAPEVNALGECTWCGELEELHVAPDGEVGVRVFHRSALGGSARFIDEAQ